MGQFTRQYVTSENFTGYTIMSTPLYHFPATLHFSTDFDTFQVCQYKWALMRLLHWRRYVKNIHLTAGGEFAAAMEITRNAFYKQKLSPEESIALGEAWILEKYANIYFADGYDDTKEVKTPERMAFVFKELWRNYPLHLEPIHPFIMENGELSVEQEMRVPLDKLHPTLGMPLVLVGTLDKIGLQGTLVKGVDEKTASQLKEKTQENMDMLRTSGQFVEYCAMANRLPKIFGDLQMQHFVVHKIVCKKSYPKGESIINRFEFNIDFWYQETWWKNMLRQVDVMLKGFEHLQEQGNLDYFLRAYGSSCNMYNKPCQFTMHCTSGTCQDLTTLDFKQVVCNRETQGKVVPLAIWIEYEKGNLTLDEVFTKVEPAVIQQPETVDDYLDSFL